MRSFQEKTPFPAGYETVSHPTYLLARDEDCENAFHSTADFVRKLCSSNRVASSHCLILCYG